MIYIESPSNDPRFNLALEQYVFDNMDKSKEYFMLWQNDNTIVVGKHQNAISEINMEYVKEHNIKVVRRLSGGGAVYHDMGNLCFTFIVDGGDMSTFDFSKFCIPIIKALDKFGVKAELNGRNDMTIDGKKFSGNSQYSKNNRVLHHGTIMYNSNIGVVAASLNVSKDKIESKGIKSVKSRVTNVKEYIKDDIHVDEFKNMLLRFMFEDGDIEEYKLTENDLKEIIKIKENKYDTWEWTFGSSPRYNILKERRIEGCGKIEIYMEVKNGIINSLQIYGDYFGNGDNREIAELLIGRKIEENDIKDAIKDVNIGYYFNNMTKKDFVDILIM
ncbi:MAG: lipoate--protein ligase [Lachnospiraceae bacterium]|nr:lipoate--protein ligase [Lachnospiraceae bacterium]